MREYLNTANRSLPIVEIRCNKTRKQSKFDIDTGINNNYINKACTLQTRKMMYPITITSIHGHLIDTKLGLNIIHESLSAVVKKRSICR